MNIETELCKRLASVFQGILNGVEIHGNWIPDDDIKGVEVYEGRRLDVNVGSRKYDGYSSPMAEMAVTIEGDFAAEEDTSLSDTMGAYEAVVEKLEEWHHDIAAVKRDLAFDRFTPVGLKIDGGPPIEIDRDTNKRSFTQQFTVRGRVLSQTNQPTNQQNN